MKAEIKSGIQDIIRDAGLGREVNLYYDIKSKRVFAGGEDKQGNAIFIGLIQSPINEEGKYIRL